MQRQLIVRIVVDVALFGCAVFGLWWLVFPIGIVCAWYYRKFYELVAASLFIDVIYSVPRDKFFGLQYIYSIAALVVFLVISALKSRIRKDIWQKTF